MYIKCMIVIPRQKDDKKGESNCLLIVSLDNDEYFK